jgi:tetratricopeptide (TPR) repeat protein
MKLIPILLLALLALQARAALQGDQAAAAGEWEEAAGSYAAALGDAPDDVRLRYNLGTALVRSGRFDEGRIELERAIRDAVGEVGFRAVFNRGNADLEGVLGVEISLEEAVVRLERAVESYREALRRRPADADAKWNLELCERLLEALRTAGGGGGGPDDPAPAGGGEAEQPRPADPRPDPESAAAAGGLPAMTPEEAEDVLRQVMEREAAIQRQALRREPTRDPRLRDW